MGGSLPFLLGGGNSPRHASVFLKLYNAIEISYKIVNVPKYFFLSSFSVIKSLAISYKSKLSVNSLWIARRMQLFKKFSVIVDHKYVNTRLKVENDCSAKFSCFLFI